MEDAPKIDVRPGEGGKLVYDKERRTIVAENLPCPICRGVEGCDHTAPERRAAASLWTAPGADDLTFGSLLDQMISQMFQRVETLDHNAPHRKYTECHCCGGNDQDRATGQRPSSALVKHDSRCLLAQHLPRLRAMASRGVT